jgi:hypothetical protein
MYAKWLGPCGMLAVLLGVAPLATTAQGDYYRDEEGRGPIQVTNDWRDGVRITLWTHHPTAPRRRIRGRGETARPISAGPHRRDGPRRGRAERPDRARAGRRRPQTPLSSAAAAAPPHGPAETARPRIPGFGKPLRSEAA